MTMYNNETSSRTSTGSALSARSSSNPARRRASASVRSSFPYRGGAHARSLALDSARSTLIAARRADQVRLPSDPAEGSARSHHRLCSPQTVVALLDDSTIGPRLVCPDPACCPTGRQALLEDSRAHAVSSRARQLAQLNAVHHPRWAWTHLADAAQRGVQIGERINALAARRRGEITRADLSALRAVVTTAEIRRRTARRRRAD